MFPDSLDVYEVKSMERQLRLAAAAERSRYADVAAARGSLPVLAAARRFFAAALGRIAALAHDSRDGLRSSEQELAALGVRWGSDPAYDAMLARQIEAARGRSRAGDPATQGAPAAARPCLLPTAPLPVPPRPAVPSQA
jgi:hypothetical protein